MELHILLAGVEFGPYSEDKARQLLDEGFLSASDPAKRLDEADWLPLSEVLGVASADEIPSHEFTALAATLDEEPMEEFHAPLPAGSEVAEASVDESPDFSSEIQESEPEVEPFAPEPPSPPTPAETKFPKPNLTVSRPTTPVFRSTMPIPARPGTTSLPPPRLTPESKSATQSLPKTKTRRLADTDLKRATATQSTLKPATPEIKSSFAAALAKTRSVAVGDTSPLPAPTRPSARPSPPPSPEPDPKPSRPATLAPKLEPPEGARVTSPIRVASLSATATSPLISVASASRAKKPTVTGSLAVKEALLRARDRTGVLGARMTSSLAPAADFEPEPAVARKRKPVVLAGRETAAPEPEAAPQRKAIRLTSSISMVSKPSLKEAEPAARLAPPLPDEPVAEPKVSAPSVAIPEPEVPKAEPAPAPEPAKREEPPAKPSQRKAIKLTGPISLPGRTTQPKPLVSPGTAETTPLTGLLTRPNRRGVALPVAKETPKAPVVEPIIPVEAPRTPPPIPPVEAAAPIAAKLEEPETRPEPELTASGQLMSSGSLKITGALRQPPAPRTPIRLSSPSGESVLGVPSGEETADAPAKPASPVPEEELTHRAPSGKIPVHEFPTEGVRVRTTRRLTSKVPLPTSPNEAITAESPQRVPPPLPKRIEVPPVLPPVEPIPVAAAIMPGPADVIVEQPVDTPIDKPEAVAEPEEESATEFTELTTESPAEPETEPAPLPAPEPEVPAAPTEATKPEKVRLRRPVKLELSSRKINDSGRLTLEAFSKMASLPTSPPAEAAPSATTPEPEAGAGTEDFGARKLTEAPPLAWAPVGRRIQPSLEWIFYGIILIGFVATGIIAYMVFHRTTAPAVTPETTENPSAVSNQAPTSAESSTLTVPPASAAPPTNASTPPSTTAVTPSTPPPASATPPAMVTPAETTTNTPVATPAPASPSSSLSQDAARQASAFVSDGILKYQQGDFENAIAAYNQALTINPKSTEAFFNRGLAKAAGDDLDGAVADYSQALDIDSNMGQAYYYRGLARHSKGDLDGAISDYNNAVRIDPKKSIAFFNRSMIRMQKDDIDGAIVDSTRALELDPHQIQSYYNRGLGRMAKGAADGALSDMRMFIQLAPQDPRSDGAVFVDYARLYTWLMETQQGQLAEANKELGDAMNHGWNGKPTSMVTRIGEFLLGQISESDLIKSSASSVPVTDQGQRCEVWYFIGMRKLAAGDKEGAIDALRKCVDTQKTDYCEYILAQEALKKISGTTDNMPPPPPRASPVSLPDPGTMVPAMPH